MAKTQEIISNVRTHFGGDKAAERLAIPPDPQAALEEKLSYTPNLNDRYQEEINLVERQFKSEGLEVAPITILRGRDYERMGYAYGDYEYFGRTVGTYYHGHVLIDAQEEKFREADDYILGLGLHEAAHSAWPLAFAKLVGHTLTHLAGTSLADAAGMRDTSPLARHRGYFWEEAYADLKRVQGLRAVGRSQRVSQLSADQAYASTGNVHACYIDAGTTAKLIDYGDDSAAPKEVFDADSAAIKAIPAKETLISLPTEFSFGSVVDIADGQPRLVTRASNVAAYAAQLLEDHRPGLFSDLEAGTWDVFARLRFARKVNGIRPGLYDELRALRYTGQDFRTGFIKIAEALGIQDSEIHG